MDESGTQFIDADMWQGKKDEITYQYLLMEHLRRCMKLGSQEHGEGYERMIEVSPGRFINVYQPATNEAFSNAVDMLDKILYPEMNEEEKNKSDLYKMDAGQLRKESMKEAGKTKKGWRTVYFRLVMDQQWEKFGWLCEILKRKNYMTSAGYTDN